MRVLLIGSGGREHALAWKLRQSPKVSKIVVAPGNGGLASFCEIREVAQDDLIGLVALAEEIRPHLVIVGPETPLVLGLTDLLQAKGFKVFGPSKAAARIEGSKSFAKDFMVKYNLPTAQYATFTDYEKAKNYLKEAKFPLVIKADGLAAGKGVIICQDISEGQEALKSMMVDEQFGAAGDLVLIEEFLVGEEASMLAITDGQTIRPCPSAQDHKAVFDGDQGPNTGGMGAYSPAPVISPELAELVLEKIMKPAVAGLAQEGSPFCGVLYAGLMICADGPKLLEFNARFGDPETQALLMRLESDLFDLCEAAASGTLNQIEPEWSPDPAICVVMSAPGYPGDYKKGDTISGLAEAEKTPGVMIFHAGTKKDEQGRITSSGGRVLGVCAKRKSLVESIKAAYEAVEKITWPGAHYRCDIAQKALNRKF